MEKLRELFIGKRSKGYDRQNMIKCRMMYDEILKVKLSIYTIE